LLSTSRPALAPLGLDACLHRAHVLDHARIERAPVDERRDPALESARGLRRAREVAQSQQHLALPLGAAQLVVAERALHSAHQRARRALGPQVEVDAVGEALVGALLEPTLELAHHRRGGFARGVAALVGWRLAHEVEIDVGREVELATAELAEREQRRRLAFSRRERERAAQHAVGEVGELGESGLERTSEVARRDPQQAAVLRAAQRGPVGVGGRGIGRGSELAGEIAGPFRRAHQPAAEEGTVAEHVRERRACGDRVAALAMRCRERNQPMCADTRRGAREQRRQPAPERLREIGSRAAAPIAAPSPAGSGAPARARSSTRGSPVRSDSITRRASSFTRGAG
jgi:hypothetical protein